MTDDQFYDQKLKALLKVLLQAIPIGKEAELRTIIELVLDIAERGRRA